MDLSMAASLLASPLIYPGLLSILLYEREVVKKRFRGSCAQRFRYGFKSCALENVIPFTGAEGT